MGKPVAEIKPLWERHRGDLRKLLQSTEDSSASPNIISRSCTVQDLVMRLLNGDLDTQEDLHLDNNDLNLAGLHLHETLPDWINEHYGSSQAEWSLYYDCLTSIATSDRQDYYTFFHQHWSLFPLSFQSKLQAVNHLLFKKRTPAKSIPAGKGWKFQYTAVLARQSWLFNQFKYLCELRDCLEANGGLYRDGGLELALWTASLLNSVASDGSHLMAGGLVATNDATKDRVKRWLKTLAVPQIPPCPIGVAR